MTSTTSLSRFKEYVRLSIVARTLASIFLYESVCLTLMCLYDAGERSTRQRSKTTHWLMCMATCLTLPHDIWYVITISPIHFGLRRSTSLSDLLNLFVCGFVRVQTGDWREGCVLGAYCPRRIQC